MPSFPPIDRTKYPDIIQTDSLYNFRDLSAKGLCEPNHIFRCAAPGTASAEDVRRFIGSELNIRTLMDLRDEKEAGTQEDKAVSNQFIL